MMRHPTLFLFILLASLTPLNGSIASAATGLADGDSGFGWEASGRVQVTVGADFENTRTASGSIGGGLSDTLEVDQGSASARALYSVTTEDYRLRATAMVQAQGSVEVGENSFLAASAFTRATIRWHDTILISGGDGPLPSDTVLLNWRVDGNFIGSVDTSERFSGSGGGVEFDVPTSNDPLLSTSRHLIWQDDQLLTTGPTRVSRVVTFSQILNAGSPTLVEAVFEIDASTNGGSMQVMFGNTAELSSITLLDGSTPESHGFVISFASGAPTPNAIPEPSASLLFVCLALAGATRRQRRGFSPRERQGDICCKTPAASA